MKKLIVLILFALAGCAWPGVDTHEHHPVYPQPFDYYQGTNAPPK